jgi:hypothetical protein
MSERRIAGGAGILFVAMNVIATFATGKPPGFHDSVDKISQYIVEHDSQIVGSAVVAAISTVVALAFFVGVWRLLRRAEGGDTFDFSTVFLAGGIVASAIVVVATAVSAVPAFESENLEAPPNTIVRFSWDLQGVLFTLLGGVLVALLLAAAISILRSGGLPRWLGWLALLGAAAEVGGALGITREGLYKAGLFTGFLPIMVWTLAASVSLMASRDT